MDPQALDHQSGPLAELESQLRSHQAHLHVVTGPSGVGKTWIAKRAARHLVSSDAHVFLARGQESWRRSEFAPIRYGIAAAGRRLATRSATSSASDALKAAGQATLGITELVRILASIPMRGDPKTRALSDEQRRLLTDLRDAVPRGRWVFIADDLHLWDADSLKLIRLCVLEPLRRTMPFLANCSVIATLRDDADGSNPDLDALFADDEPSRIAVPKMPPAHVASALEHFGFESESVPSLALSRLSGGHLQLLKDLANYFVRTGRPCPFSTAESELDLYYIVKKRIAATAPDASSIADALSIVATIGLQFSRYQAICLLEAVQSIQARDTLDKMIELSLLERVGSSLAFEHADVREAFYARTGTAKARYHERFATCMRELHPGDYATRAYHLALAGDSHSSAIMSVHASLQHARCDGLGVDCSNNDPPVSGDFVVAWASPLRDATKEWLGGRYMEAVRILEAMPVQGPPTLLAERAYLLADCWLKTLSVPERRQAVDLLEEWKNLLADEFELWFRLTSLLLIAYIQTRMEQEAARLELEVANALGVRLRTDVSYASYKYSLFRRADALHDPDVAIRRLRESVSYFQPQEGLSYSPSEYLRCTANLVGCLVLVGEYSQALAHGRIAATHLSSLPDTSARSLYLANNTLLASYLSGSDAPETLVEQFKLLIKRASRFEDVLLLRVNLSTVLIGLGRHADASAVLDVCATELNRSFDPDGYYMYFVKNNMTLLRYCRDRVYDPLRDWKDMERCLQDMPRGVRELIAERHGAVFSLLTNRVPRNSNDLEVAVRAHRLIPQRGPWTFFARAFLLSETQYWSDG